VKFLLDHDVPVEIAHLLRYWSHEVIVLKEALPVTTETADTARQSWEIRRWGGGAHLREFGTEDLLAAC
jgi:hypothetical protein